MLPSDTSSTRTERINNTPNHTFGGLKLTISVSYTTGVLWAVIYATASQVIFDCFEDRAMKAIVYREFGPPDVLELVDVKRPEPGQSDL